MPLVVFKEESQVRRISIVVVLVGFFLGVGDASGSMRSAVSARPMLLDSGGGTITLLPGIQYWVEPVQGGAKVRLTCLGVTITRARLRIRSNGALFEITAHAGEGLSVSRTEE